MRDTERIDKICTLLADIWHQYPDWRFTQLLFNFIFFADATDRINFFQEDDETLRKLQMFADYMDMSG